MTAPDKSSLAQRALAFHAEGKPGKWEVLPTKQLRNAQDLSLAYSPGVAAPCLEIEKDAEKAYAYTNKGNTVAVVSNGTAVLGLGNLGALASKPVMEGKAVLFKRFAGVDAIDIELGTEDIEAFVAATKLFGPSFGGINLEDIKAPECFEIEKKIVEALDIPVMHDDQHGTAIICGAGLLNALHLTNRKIEETKLVVNGAGAAAIACATLFVALGVDKKNLTMCDSRGVIYRGREKGMNPWKEMFAQDTDKRTLEEAMEGADVFVGLSVKGALSAPMVSKMAAHPAIFAMANPDPEITPEEVARVRDDVIMATGRSDYPNQINNILGFPYVFRGALDVRASRINEAMKIAAVKALAALAREEVPQEVKEAYEGRELSFGPTYLIPTPFDPRLITRIPVAIARAAMESGVARKPIEDWAAYEEKLQKML